MVRHLYPIHIENTTFWSYSISWTEHYWVLL